ncbi:MAG: hypothetical protein AAFW98_01270 [Pseudomonadota bacterium]
MGFHQRLTVPRQQQEVLPAVELMQSTPLAMADLAAAREQAAQMNAATNAPGLTPDAVGAWADARGLEQVMGGVPVSPGTSVAPVPAGLSIATRPAEGFFDFDPQMTGGVVVPEAFTQVVTEQLPPEHPDRPSDILPEGPFSTRNLEDPITSPTPYDAVAMAPGVSVVPTSPLMDDTVHIDMTNIASLGQPTGTVPVASGSPTAAIPSVAQATIAAPQPATVSAAPIQAAAAPPPEQATPFFHDSIPGATPVPTTTVTRTPEEQVAAAQAVAAQTAPVVSPEVVSIPTVDAPTPVPAVMDLPTVTPAPTTPVATPEPIAPAVTAPSPVTPAPVSVPTAPVMPEAPQPTTMTPTPAVMAPPQPQPTTVPSPPTTPPAAPPVPTVAGPVAAPNVGSSGISTFSQQTQAIPHTNEPGFVQGLAPSLIEEAKARGVTAPDGMLIGYSPIGGFAAVHPSAVTPAATGSGIFGMLGMNDAAFAQQASKVPGRVIGGALGGTAGTMVGGPIGGLFGSMLGGMLGGHTSQGLINQQAVNAGYATPVTTGGSGLGGLFGGLFGGSGTASDPTSGTSPSTGGGISSGSFEDTRDSSIHGY